MIDDGKFKAKDKTKHPKRAPTEEHQLEVYMTNNKIEPKKFAIEEQKNEMSSDSGGGLQTDSSGDEVEEEKKEKEEISTEMTVCFDTNMGLFGNSAFGIANKTFEKEQNL